MDWGIGLLRSPGRTAALAVIGGALALRIIDPSIVTELRVRGFDLAERIWPRTSDAADVAIVDIDEELRPIRAVAVAAAHGGRTRPPH